MSMKHTLALAAALFCPLLATAHDYTAGDLRIEHPWSREMPPVAPTAAAYFVVHNQGTQADRLLGADTPAAAKAELHEHIHQNGLMKMQQVQVVEVPGKGQARFAPMGYHVMLFGLQRQFKSGERFPLTLHFERAGDVQVEVAVEQDAPAAEHH